jgi:hypothetical protein
VSGNQAEEKLLGNRDMNNVRCRSQLNLNGGRFGGSYQPNHCSRACGGKKAGFVHACGCLISSAQFATATQILNPSSSTALVDINWILR